MIRAVAASFLLIASATVGHSLADDSNADVAKTVEDDPSAEPDRANGLAAWDRIHDVFTHPRCLNCHVGTDNVPLWTAENGAKIKAHGMQINGGDSRIGAETYLCSNCHGVSTEPNSVAHAAPHTGMIWRLAPVAFQWTDRSNAEICEQVRAPESNGGRVPEGLVEHIVHDMKLSGFISWGFAPGPGRQAPPGTLQSHLDDMKLWTAAGMPCPTEEK